jgi:hypothetical protein
LAWLPKAQRGAFITWLSNDSRMLDLYEQDGLAAVRLFVMEKCQ